MPAELASGAASTAQRAHPALELRDVTKRFGGVAAVSDLSIEVQFGEILGVIGPNGAGKSTLLSLVNAAQRPTSGEIIFDGEHRVDRMRSYTAARLGIARAHQIPRPFPRMTVRDNLLVAASSKGGGLTGRAAHVGEVLELCGLVDRAGRLASTLPLLDLKRLEVARALALDPRMLLLDEVAAGLVAHEVDEIAELIAGIHQQGVTIMLVEHVQALVQALAHRVVVLDFGRQITEGTPQQVADDPEVIRIYLGSGESGMTRRDRPRQGPARPDLLQVEGLSVNYGKLRALRELDFTVGAAEVVAVLGANGAGKTSLARALVGLMPSTAGTIQLAGRDITRVPAHLRARSGLAMCHEGRRLFANMTIRENLELATYSGAATAHQAALYERVYSLFPILRERADALAAELSGGQQQMVAVARALMSDPKLVIFDELSLGLAPAVIDQIYEAIEEIRSWEVSIVLIEQNAYRALAVADRAYVLEHGKVSYAGAPEPLQDGDALRDAYFGGRVSGEQAHWGTDRGGDRP